MHTGYYLSKVEIKDYNVMIDVMTFFDQTVQNNYRIYENILKIVTGQEMIT